MPRHFPANCPEHPVALATETVEVKYDITVITPLLGGGAIPKTNDAVTLVRGPSVRGHLRFWWRATRGRSCRSAADLFEEESRVWGSTAVASNVRIDVVVTQTGRVLGAEAAGSCPKYVMFPFQPTDVAQSHVDVIFQLKMTLPAEMKDDADAAVWAWTNFGGIGSRTRRGCGALFCAQTAPASEAVIADWWKKMQARCAGFDGASRGWPVLGPAAMVGPVQQSAQAVWIHLINQWQYFRQQPGFARNKGGQRPGRSRWPEADSLKAHTKQAAYGHQDSITIPDPQHAPAFPRAGLGLPIVFDFRPNREELANKGTLEPGDTERMASPFLLRPWKMTNGKVLPLYAPVPGALKYRFSKGATWDIPGGHTAYLRPDLAAYGGSPMNGLTQSGSAAEAFQNFLCLDRGFEVLGQ